MYKNTGTAMVFDWDERKNRRNRAKHHVSFEAATLAFEDPHAITILERVEEGEERWQTVGTAIGVVVLLIVHTCREEGGEEHIRMISARKATPQERKVYEEGL
jgi:uncharacterized DUF497 family protein